MTTKEQERKALEQIKKIVAGLGDDSYVATAFEGVFEVAEENINNDFACSLMQRVQGAESEIVWQAEQIEHLRKTVETLQRENESKARMIQAEIEKRQAAEKKQLPDAMKASIMAMMQNTAEKARQIMAGTADIMADLSDHPNDMAFAAAAKSYKKSRAEAIRAEQIIEQIKNI